MFGFKDFLDYYKTISTSGRLKKIRLPTFILSSKDDFVFEIKEDITKEI